MACPSRLHGTAALPCSSVNYTKTHDTTMSPTTEVVLEKENHGQPNYTNAARHRARRG